MSVLFKTLPSRLRSASLSITQETQTALDRFKQTVTDAIIGTASDKAARVKILEHHFFNSENWKNIVGTMAESDLLLFTPHIEHATDTLLVHPANRSKEGSSDISSARRVRRSEA